MADSGRESGAIEAGGDYWTQSSSPFFALQGELRLTLVHPAILRMAGDVQGRRILDFGCGDGVLATQLAARGASVVAVDKSAAAVDLAIRSCGSFGRLRFRRIRPDSNLPAYSCVLEDSPYDLAILSFVLVTVATPEEAEAIFTMLGRGIRAGGRLIFAESHPCFQHLGFSAATMRHREEDYRRICSPFSVELRDAYDPRKKVEFTDFHRPLSNIVDLFSNAGFLIRKIEELYDDASTPGLHSETRSRVNQMVPPYIVVEGVKGTG
jgi:SAM-dependent methyltransferase